MPILENADPTEPRLDPDLGLTKPQQADGEAAGTEPTGEFADVEVLAFLGEARRLGRNYQQMVTMANWEASQAAYRSEHSEGSKYRKDQYKNRAKYFKPKTRSAVRKNLTATANALFASADVMSCDANDDGNQLEQANAALIKELVNARFNSKSMKTGVPWFQTAIGARVDTQIMGVVCSKQDWEYRVERKTVKTQKEQPALHPTTSEQLYHEDGQQMIEVVDAQEEKVDVQADKPRITLIPAEQVIIDGSASWINPAQTSPTLIVQWPMHIDDVRQMMKAEKNVTPWREISDEQLAGAYYSEAEVMGLKAAREGNSARPNQSVAKFGGHRNEIVDVWECFFRKNGCEYHCWTLKNQSMLSEVVPVIEVYPAHRGTRPIVIGTDMLEPHVLYPESAVASWKQAQDEINDFANLRMDATRQSVFPTAKVVAGKNIDYKAVQRRDGQGIILVRDQTDVEWDRPPGVSAGAYQESNLLNNDLDELAGIFSQGSVQANRQLGDTVGGMQMISSNANATSEFDLRCFIETWAEPVLSQIVMLEQYYEDDEVLLATSGEKAKLFMKFGVSAVTDELLESQISITLNIGYGSSDPMQQLAKFKTTFDIAMPLLAEAIKSGKAEINYEEVFSEIFGKAGYRNGAERFIKINPEGQGGPSIPPEAMQQLQEKMQQLEQQNQQMTLALKDKSQKTALDHAATQAQQAQDLQVQREKISSDAKTAHNDALMSLLRDTMVARINAGQGTDAAALDARTEMLLGLVQSGLDAHVQLKTAAMLPAPQGAQ